MTFSSNYANIMFNILIIRNIGGFASEHLSPCLHLANPDWYFNSHLLNPFLAFLWILTWIFSLLCVSTELCIDPYHWTYDQDLLQNLHNPGQNEDVGSLVNKLLRIFKWWHGTLNHMLLSMGPFVTAQLTSPWSRPYLWRCNQILCYVFCVDFGLLITH